MLGSIRSAVDTGQLKEAAKSPGIDPRVWLTYAIVTAVSYDAEHGVFCDIKYQPRGEEETALLGASYAGSGFGTYCPVNINDTVLVAVANGDPQTGPVVVARLWNAGDPPPSAAGSGETASLDVSTTVQTDKNYTITTQGSGNIDLVLGGLINLVKSDATQPYVRGSDFASQMTTFLSVLKIAFNADSAGWSAVGAALGNGAAFATAAAASTAAATACDTLAATLVPGQVLSEKVFGE